MEEIKNTAIDPATDTGAGIMRYIRRAISSFDGMRHSFIAFLIPAAIMVLIYTAIGVWPVGKNSVLVLDLNGQYVYYFEAIRDFFRGEQGILYSFERALGGEFLGIVAYYLASPFSIITALFPEGMITESLYVMLILKCGLSGFNMCTYTPRSYYAEQHRHRTFFSLLKIPMDSPRIEEIFKRKMFITNMLLSLYRTKKLPFLA